VSTAHLPAALRSAVPDSDRGSFAVGAPLQWRVFDANTRAILERATKIGHKMSRVVAAAKQAEANE
jgi:hypothetical protein